MSAAAWIILGKAFAWCFAAAAAGALVTVAYINNDGFGDGDDDE